jgi:hypothetical protein
MARWKLTDAHYLNVPGTEWEYRETNRDTGRQARKVYEIPMYLSPKDPADFNYPQDEAIVVSNKFDPVYPRDIIFRGPPTPDMEPLDDEAQTITQGFIESGAWKHPIEALNMTYSQSVLSEFEQKLAELMTQGLPKYSGQSVSTKGVDQAAFERLQQQVAQLVERNTQLEETVAKSSAGAMRRRV